MSQKSNPGPAAPPRNYPTARKRKKCKTDWSGVGIQDAFKPGLPYQFKQAAQRLFYRRLKRDQAQVVNLAAEANDSRFKARPQLGPCYTSFPSLLAAVAAVGLTAFMEYKLRRPTRLINTRMKAYLANPGREDGVPQYSKAYQYLAQQIAAAVDTRLLIHDLTPIESIEIYRLFASSMQTRRFESVPEIIFAGVMFGDVWPEPADEEIHPLSKKILTSIVEISRRYYQDLQTGGPRDLAELGIAWVRQIAKALIEHLPEIVPESQKGLDSDDDDQEELFSFEDDPDHTPGLELPPPDPAYGFMAGHNEDLKVPPLDQPHAPSLYPPENLWDFISAVDQHLSGSAIRDTKHQQELTADDLARNILSQFQNLCKDIEAASAQVRNIDDLRHDLLEQMLRATAFDAGPLQGGQEEGHEVSVNLSHKTMTGEIFDKPLEPGDDIAEYEQIMMDADPIAQALKKSLYPGLENHMELERFRPGGSLDPARLAVAAFSEASYRRHHPILEPGKKGSPLLVIACDSSGSLDRSQMRMLKVLTTAWLNGTQKTNVTLLAGIYHSDRLRGEDRPLVQWLHHPRKTRAFDVHQTSINIASLPSRGTGAQRDAVSLAFIMDEAREVAQGKNIFLTIITDASWNKSFDGIESPEEEVHACLANIKKNFGPKLHLTIVTLAARSETGIEDICDHHIPVDAAELAEYASVAEKISAYQASVIKAGTAGRKKP